MRTTLLFLYFVLILGSHDCSIEWTSFGKIKKITFWGWYDHIKRKRQFEKIIFDQKIEIERLNELEFYDDQPRQGSTDYMVMEEENETLTLSNTALTNRISDQNETINNTNTVLKLFVDHFHESEQLVPLEIQNALATIITGATVTTPKLYIDMDGVLVDFQSGIDTLEPVTKELFKGHFDEVPNIFSKMLPIEGAVEAFNLLSEHFDVYILSTPCWNNDTSWSDKVNWVKKYLGEKAHKRLILSHHKELQIGDYLIDDRTANGAGEFKGKHIHFGTKEFENWKDVLDYFNLLDLSR